MVRNRIGDVQVQRLRVLSGNRVRLLQSLDLLALLDPLRAVRPRQPGRGGLRILEGAALLDTGHEVVLLRSLRECGRLRLGYLGLPIRA